LLTLELEQAGHTVLAAADGRTALATALTARPDVALLDRDMSGLSGVQVCREVKANPLTADLPVIFLSDGDDGADVHSGQAAGADDYLTKPFSPQELLARVRAAAERRHRRGAESAATDARLTTHYAHWDFRRVSAGGRL
jgi:DNA-binding response OmpR family regulator